ncbi:hypothetical protein ACFUKV_21390 [Streptomyces paradoxus]|uniref:hypothetical protein n=1 Tax=Streptomyces paradoxus TaxID=66375 RepID=UPI0036442E9E
MRRALRISVVAAAALALSVGSTASARPASENAGWVYAKKNAASGYFFHVGDDFSIVDKKADGHSAVLEVAFWDPDEQGHYGTFQVWNTRGEGRGFKEPHNLPEGYAVQIRACVGESSDRGNWWDCDAQDIGHA